MKKNYSFHTFEERALIKEIGSYRFSKMKSLKLNSKEELEMYEKQKEEEKELRKQIGNANFYKMKRLGFKTFEEWETYQKQKKQKREYREQIGSDLYYKMRKLGFKTIEDYQDYNTQKKKKTAEIRHTKNKIRYRTIRYIERKCNIERVCQICGQKAEIHHPDYNQYLVVNLLCRKHHMELHKGIIKQPPTIDLMNHALIERIS